MNTNTTNTTNTKPASRPAGFTKYDWESKTFRVYDGLIKLSEQKIIAPQFVNHPIVKELLEKCCGANTPELRWKLCFALFVHMDNYGSKDGEKVLKIKTVTALRQFLNGGWREKMARPVSHKEAKEPVKKAKKATQKAKKSEVKKVKNVSVAQWVKGLTPDQIDLLKVEIASREMGLDEVA